jgi:plastocyanin
MSARAAVLGIVTAALAAPGAARAADATIAIPGKYFDPARSTVVAGDRVTWRNNDLTTHDVRVAGGLLDSGPIPRFAAWSQGFDRPAGYPFVCTLHPFMTGHLDVVAAMLRAGADTLLAGEPLTLAVRAPAGTAQLMLERSVEGVWSTVVHAVVPRPDGTFKVTTPAVEGASYRVTTAVGSSPAVTPDITPGVEVHLMVKRRGDRTTVRVHTRPATAGMLATLQLYSRWHFRWRDVRRARLDHVGRVRFRLRAGRRGYLRVALSRRTRGRVLVQSAAIKLAGGRPARDPDAIVPPDGGGHHA